MTKIAHNKNQRSRTKRVREGRGHNTNHGWLARMSFPRLLRNYHMPGFSRNIRGNCFAFKSFTRLWHKLVHYGDIRSSDYASAFKNSIIRCMSRVTFAEIESAALRLHSLGCRTEEQKSANKVCKTCQTCKRAFRQSKHTDLFRMFFRDFFESIYFLKMLLFRNII